MATASEIDLPKWQAPRDFCQNGRLSKYCAKYPPANTVPNKNIRAGKSSPVLSLFHFLDNADMKCRIEASPQEK
jgi:hypothetical protein